MFTRRDLLKVGLVSGAYSLTGMSGPHGGVKFTDPLKTSQWTPEALSGAGVR